MNKTGAGGGGLKPQGHARNFTRTGFNERVSLEVSVRACVHLHVCLRASTRMCER